MMVGVTFVLSSCTTSSSSSLFQNHHVLLCFSQTNHFSRVYGRTGVTKWARQHPKSSKAFGKKTLTSAREMKLLRGIDFVLPLKAEGVCLRAVVEQIYKFYDPRRIIFISRPEVLDVLSRIIQFWDISEPQRWAILFVNELTVFDSTWYRIIQQIASSLQEICNRHFYQFAHVKAERIWVVVPATYKVGHKSCCSRYFRNTMLCGTAT